MTFPPVTRALRPAILASFIALLAGCSTLGALGSASTPLDVYDLRAPENAPVVQGSRLSRDVIVELPTTSGVLETDRILIRPDALQAQYLPDVRWGDEVPVMVQTLMLRALENTGGLRYVGRRPLGGSGDYAIVSDIVDFQAETIEDREGATVRLRVTSRIVREDDVRIIATRSFTASALSPTDRTEDIVGAFDAASDQLLLDFADWVMGTLGRRLTAPAAG